MIVQDYVAKIKRLSVDKTSSIFLVSGTICISQTTLDLTLIKGLGNVFPVGK